VSNDHVVVVGGGLAGISAALTLADAGAAVTLLESKARLGGATWSFRRRGLSFDNGQHVFLRCCTSYLAFLERLGASSSVHLQDRLDLPVVAPGGARARLRRSRLPAPLHLAGSLIRYRHVPLTDRLRLGRALLPLRRADLADAALDDTTFAEFLHRHGQSDAAIGRLWDLICVPTVNLPASDASLTLAATVFQIGLLTDAAAGDIGWSRIPLSELHADHATAALERVGTDVRTSTPVERIEGSGGGAAVTTATERIEAEAVVVAVPHDVAARLLADAVVGATRWSELGTSPIVNVHLVYDRRVIHEEFLAVVDSPLQFVFDRTATSGLADRSSGGEQCLAVSLSAASKWIAAPADALVAMAHDELARLFPAASAARLLDSVVVRERAATFAGRPGTRRLRPGPVTGVRGLYVAGAWTDTGWPATMEGAVRSGVAAAEAVLGGRHTAVVPHPEEVRA
jgi:squalene-associated FAD-dependent desaturase